MNQQLIDIINDFGDPNGWVKCSIILPDLEIVEISLRNGARAIALCNKSRGHWDIGAEKLPLTDVLFWNKLSSDPEELNHESD